MNAEQIIKAALDGTFTTVRADGQVVKSHVAVDFIPSYDPIPKPTGKRGPGKGKRHIWTPEEDEELQRLRRMGWSKARCATVFGCTVDAVARRITFYRERLRGEWE